MGIDVLVVGAGFAGCVAARRLADTGMRVLLIDKRPHIGGNAYDEHDTHGVLVQTYGPHIFHTNHGDVWNYLSQFTDWTPYSHHVLASVDGELIPLPFNLNSIRAFFPANEALRIEHLLIDRYGYDSTVPVLTLRESEFSELRKLADLVYKRIFYKYTQKQWGVRPEELSPIVTGRVPIRVSEDNRYFTDTYQAMPARGYTRMFELMLSSPNISVDLETDYASIRGKVKAVNTIYTGPIDEYFDCCFGPLPYRSLQFISEHFPNTEYIQPVAVVNYPNEHDYTRITEFKHMTGQRHAGSTVMFEYPTSAGEPYYPVSNDCNREHFDRYWELASHETGITFLGRLAEYRYYDMDDVVHAAMIAANRILQADAEGAE